MHIGVIGLGYWGSKHVRVLGSMRGVDRVTGFDVNADRARSLQATYPAMAIAANKSELFERVDGVVIATHPSTHAALSIAAMTLGAHVLIEKPMALNMPDAIAMLDASEALGRVLMVGHTFAFNPAVRALRDLVHRGTLGTLLHIKSQRLNLGLYQSDCDVVWDLAPHDISIINLLLGTSPAAVNSWGRGHIDPSVIDNAYLNLDYATSGVQAVVHVSWLDPHKVRQLTIVGSEKMVVYNDLADDERIRVYDKSVTMNPRVDQHENPLSYRTGDIYSPFIPFQEPLLLQDKHFVECILSGARPLTGADAGIDVVRTLQAASTSLTQHRLVRVDDTSPTEIELTDERPMVHLR